MSRSLWSSSDMLCRRRPGRTGCFNDRVATLVWPITQRRQMTSAQDQVDQIKIRPLGDCLLRAYFFK
jgi:hypothetical protein